MTVFTGICLVILCITTVETVLWAYTVFIHCRWSIAHDVPDRRSISYEALSIFSGMTGTFCFGTWLGFVYISSVASSHIICLLVVAIILFGFHIMACHCWHLVSAYVNIPLEYVPYTSKFLIILSNKLLSKGYTVNSIPLGSWEEFYIKAKEHKSLLINFIDKSPDMFWTKDEEGKYTYVNESTARDLLLTKESDILNKTSQEVSNELRTRGLEYTFSNHCDNTDAYTIERKKPTLFFEYGNIGKKFLALRIMKAPIFNKESKIIGIMGVGRNITYHIETYDKIEKLMNEGKYKEAKRAFLSYKQIFESMKDVKEPEAFIKGMR